MTQTFFTSDLHLHHGNIMKFCRRPGLSKEEQAALEAGKEFNVSPESVSLMDDYLIDNINRLVKPDDTLWILGDFCFAKQSKFYVKNALRYRERIDCHNVNMVWGNHDGVDKIGLKGMFNVEPTIASVGEMIGCSAIDVVINGQLIVLSHYAHLTWNKSHRGSWNLYGHSHNSLEEFADQALPGRKSMDVGVDAIARRLSGVTDHGVYPWGQPEHYRPISFDEVKEIMDAQPGYHQIDHHKPRSRPVDYEEGD